MNVTSITDYILKLEKLNAESLTKIEQLKKLLTEANEEKVAALNELNSLYHTTARVTEKKCVNQGLVDRLLELGEMTSDFYKTAAYNQRVEIVYKSCGLRAAFSGYTRASILWTPPNGNAAA